jgi:carboxylesterase
MNDDDRFTRAEAAFDASDALSGEPVAADGRSLRFTHGRRTPRVTIFFHGLSAVPRQFAALAAHAYGQGDNVLMPRLPQHGHVDRMTEALRDLRADDLVAFAREQVALAREFGNTVRVVGFSMGGLLAAWIAQEECVSEAIAIAPFLGIAGVPRRLTPFLTRTLRERRNAFLWWDPFRRERMLPARGYPRYATHAIAEGLVLAERLGTRARQTPPRSPITLVINVNESAVNNAAIRQLAAAWHAAGTAHMRLHRLTGVGPSHDIIEPENNRTSIAHSYPDLLKLLGGSS